MVGRKGQRNGAVGGVRGLGVVGGGLLWGGEMSSPSSSHGGFLYREQGREGRARKVGGWVGMAVKARERETL